jgi:lipid A 3-O-deacylase
VISAKGPGGIVKAKIFLVAIVAMLLISPAAHAQSGPEEGGHEFQLWTSGGHAVSGSTSADGVWSFGGRMGFILTKPHGPGFLRGRLEYAADLIPVFYVFQPGHNAFGASFDPVVLKWNFDTGGRVVPYIETAGGVLFSNMTVPTGTSRVNFTPQAAAGLHFLGDRFNWSVEIRYEHISNAGLASPNPGINTIQARIGVGLFTHRRH